jgi:hypothetical protein
LIKATWAILQLSSGCHHYRWQCCRFWSMFTTSGCLVPVKVLLHATPSVTLDLGFSSLIKMTTPFRCLLLHAYLHGSKSCFATWDLGLYGLIWKTGPHLPQRDSNLWCKDHQISNCCTKWATRCGT